METSTEQETFNNNQQQQQPQLQDQVSLPDLNEILLVDSAAPVTRPNDLDSVHVIISDLNVEAEAMTGAAAESRPHSTILTSTMVDPTATANNESATAVNANNAANQTNESFRKNVEALLKRLNCLFLFLIIPLMLIICILLRFNFQSVIYLFLLFILPFFYPINHKSIQGGLKNFVIILILLSTSGLVGQLAFQIFLLANPPYANQNILPNCSFKQEILDEFGFNRYDKAYIIDILRIIIPDVLLLSTSIVTLVLCKKIHASQVASKRETIYNQNQISTLKDTTFTDHFCPLENVNVNVTSRENVAEPINTSRRDLAVSTSSSHSQSRINRIHRQQQQQQQRRQPVSRYLALKRIVKSLSAYILQGLFFGLLFSCAYLLPGALSVPYLFILWALIVRWSLAYDIQNSLFQKVFKIFLLFYLALHLLALYMYQIHLFQAAFEPNALYTRILGIVQYVYTDCEQPAHFFLNFDASWQQVTYPFLLFAFYWFLAVEFAYTHFDSNPTSSTTAEQPGAEHTPSIGTSRQVTPRDLPGSSKSLNEQQKHRHSSVIINTDTDTDEVNANEKQAIVNKVRQRPAIRKKRLMSAENIDEDVKMRRLKAESQLTFDTNRSSNHSHRVAGAGAGFGEAARAKFKRQTTMIIDFTVTYFNMVAKFLHKQNYLFALISMMAWSILYHSILTLVLLIWACLIWVLPNSRDRCLKTSPLLVFYSLVLVLIEYVYGLRVTVNELPEFKEIGLVRHEVPFFNLALKTGLLSFFCLTLRQYVTESRAKRQRAQNPDIMVEGQHAADLTSTATSGQHSSTMVNLFQSFLNKYWIFLSSGTLLLMSSQSEVVAYRIVYMALFLYFITSFQLTYKFWRVTLSFFHSIVIIYSMLVLLLIYIFQFDEVPEYFIRLFNIQDDRILPSIGFVKFEKKDELVVRLLTPTTFLIVNILQIHYFNKPWLDMTEKRLNREEVVNDSNETQETNTQNVSEGSDTGSKKQATKKEKEEFSAFMKRMMTNVYRFYSSLCPYLWRLAEMHSYKVILIVVALFCLNKVNFMNLILLCSILFSFVLDRTNPEKRIHVMLSGFVQIWVSLATLASMIYQLKVVDSPLVFNCSFPNESVNVTDPFLLKPEDNLVYIGLEKAADVQAYLEYYIFIFLLLTFQKIVRVKMSYTRHLTRKQAPAYSILFENITWKDLDKNVIQFLQYMINYFFYRFGLEMCFFMSSIVIIVRMDAYAILYGIWLGLFLRLKRDTIRKVWAAYFMFLLFMLPLQYIWCLGLPPILCYEYPWSAQNQLDPQNVMNKLRKWLFLSDYSDPPVSRQLIADFFQIFFVWLQLAVFNSETNKAADLDHIAGRNNELVYERAPYKDNPYKDFISDTKTILDKIKFGVYMYSYWIVLAIVYLTGTSRISLLCMGYVILSFFFLWMGQNFLVKPLDKLLKYWNVLVFYCFLVIFIKACLQIVLCLLSNKVNEQFICLMVDIFGIDCRTLPSTTCVKEGEKSEVGLMWDVVCFLILLLQRRLYMSYMFEHVVNEYKAQSTLAARGAEIFKEIINHKVEVEKKKENRVLEKLKSNVERIRRHQAKERSYEPEEHYEALRSGDYYMYNAEFEIEATDITESEDDLMSKHKTKSKKRLKKEKKIDSDDSTQAASPDQQTVAAAAAAAEATTNPDESEVKPSTSTAPEPEKQEVNIRMALVHSAIVVKPREEQANGEETAEKRQSWLTIENKTALKVFAFVKKYFLLTVDFIIDYFNKHSRDFRHVSHILSKEKLILKRDYGNTQTPSLLALLSSTINKDQPSKEPLHKVLKEEDNNYVIIAAGKDVDEEMNSKTRLNKFLSSVFYFALSQSEFICYFFMILNHLSSASLLSVPLPISIFLWAMLCIPRPTKTFWITSITYIEAVVVIKYLFQFKFFPWNTSSNVLNESVNQAIGILGIEKKDNFAIYDLYALLVIFLHRAILKRLGLWRDYLDDDELLMTSNEEEERKLQLSKIDTDIYKNKEDSDELNGEEKPQQLAIEPAPDDKYPDREENELTRHGSNENLIEACDEEQGSEENGDNENDNEENLNLNELENTCNYVFEDNLATDEECDERLRDKLKRKFEHAKKKRLVNPFIKFYEDMGSKHYAVVVDCYAKIFLCDFINCIITVFTYQYFGESARSAAGGSSSALNSIQDNKVPYSFLVMFLIQFILMIIDRALYLRKNRRGKFLFQIVLVLFVHVWVFFVLPYITKLNFVNNSAAQVWYFVKCIYFGYSSRQIRCGYPTRILGNFLTKSYSYLNLVLFKGFLLVPFLLELRSLMDWMFTDTSLGLSDWLQMEDIYSNIFVLKCFRHNEKKYPTPRGTKRKATVKYGFGGVLLTVIILIIWFPLLLFSFSESFNRSVAPASCKIDIEFSGFLPIYSMTSTQRLAMRYTKNMFDDFKKYAPEQAYTFLSDFTPDDVYCIAIPGNSTSTWQISPPSLVNLKDQLKDPEPMDFDFVYTLTREPSEQKNEQLSETISAVRQISIMNDTKGLVYNLLVNQSTTNSVKIKSIYPRYVHARAKGHLLEIDSFKNADNFNYYVDVKVALRNESNNLWWDVFDDNKNDYKPPCSRNGYLSIIVFSDKVSPSSISFITEQGIIGIYITIVLALSRFIRIMVVNSSYRIMFEQLPNVDKILKLCHSVYMVRENKQYILEEYLYAKILFLYRSPETMIKYTKTDDKKRN